MNEFGWDGESLKSLTISVESAKLDPWGIDPREATHTEYTNFQKVIDTINAGPAAAACGAAFQTDLGERGGGGGVGDESKWVFMNNQKIYENQAISGSTIGVVIAFVEFA